MKDNSLNNKLILNKYSLNQREIRIKIKSKKI